MLRKFGIIAVLSLLAVAFAAVPALAQNPHFGQGARSATCTDLGQQLQCTGTIVGLGSEPLIVTVTADATADTFSLGARRPGVPFRHALDMERTNRAARGRQGRTRSSLTATT